MVWYDHNQKVVHGADEALKAVRTTRARLDHNVRRMRLALLRRQTELEDRRRVVHKKMIDLMQKFYRSGAARASTATRQALDALEEELRPLREHVDAAAWSLENRERERTDERYWAPEQHMPFEAIGEDRSDGKLESVYHRFPTLRGVDIEPDVPVESRAERRQQHADLKARLMAVIRQKAHGLLRKHDGGGGGGGGGGVGGGGRRGALRIPDHVGRRTKGDLLRLMRHQGGRAPAPIRGGGHALLRRLVDGLLDDRQRTRLALFGALLPWELGEDQLRMFTELHTGATSSPLPVDATPMERLGSRLPASPVGALFGGDALLP